MRKTIMAMLAAAAVLVVGGALGAIAQTDESSTDDGTAVTESADRPGHGHHLANLLDEMVADGVISSDQATEITEWLEARRTELQAEREAAREAFEAAWADDVLTEDEVADLPFADRLLSDDGPFADAWADGQLTREEFDAVKAEFPGRRGFRRGPFPGASEGGVDA